jgi:16S rRNA (adenine1518-N6/adenine1519-N6)-dimethyltransferase
MKLCDSLELADFLQKHKLKPSHALGQNFLVDEKVLGKIISSAELGGDDQVIEVGAGLGVLTKELAAQAKQVTALEFDRNIFPTLQENLQELKNVDLQNLDVRKFEVPKDKYKLVANIPYYLTSPILRKFFVESDNPPEIAVLLIQREVAEKICDKQKLSVLSLEVKLFGDPEIIEVVKPESFLPPPKVDSAILKISLKTKPEIETKDLSDFFKVVHAGFRSPRKKIRGSFAAGFIGKKETAYEILEQAGIDTDLRAEDLSIGDWKNILEAYRDVKGLGK